MGRTRVFSILCWILGIGWLVVGVLGIVAFVRYHAPDSEGIELMPMGPNGYYFLAMTGCALVVWGAVLVGAARRPAAGRTVGTATALGLVLCGLYRMLAWIVGDYAAVGDVLRVEAAVFLVLALAFVWLRPPPLEVA